MFYCENFKGMTVIKSDLFDKYSISHMFSTIKDTERKTVNGVNFGFREGFPYDETIDSYKKVADYFGVPYENITKAAQTHTANIEEITEKRAGMGITKDSDFSDVDGIYTVKSGVPLCIFTADCVPVLIADKNNRAVCAVHSGWRGTAQKITENAVKIFTDELDIPLDDIICAIGPCISKCCFEVSKEVAEVFADYENSSVEKPNGKYNLDLKKINRDILLNTGISSDNIDVCELCTMCDKKLFYSYRRDGEKTGRLGNFIMR